MKDERKEELKDEMKNRISMALKDPTLQQGFEIICKNLSELEEQIETKDIQIKELQEQKCYWKESSFDWRHKFFKKERVKQIIEKEKRIVELEKENAELKEKLNFSTQYYQGEKAKDHLTKAREIIRRLMDIINHDLRCFDTMAGLDIKQKAEQFLKEIKSD